MKYIVFLLVLITTPAMAQDKSAICHFLKQHQSVKGAAYEPGVDAYGNAVIPADINASPAIPETIIVPLEIDLAQQLQGTPINGLNLEAPLGNIEIRTDGKVMMGNDNVTTKTHEWCGTPVPEPLDEVAEEVAEPPMEEKTSENSDISLENDVNSELEVIEVEPKTPILPQEVTQPAAEPDEIISGGEYRDFTGYNE